VVFTTEKTVTRSSAAAARKRIDREKKQLIDNAVTARFTESDFYKSAENILCYISIDFEVSTNDILKTCLTENSGKTLSVPRISGNEMDFFVIRSEDDLAPGAFGIREPKSCCKQFLSFKNCVCLTPGLIFTENGYRLGFGKGYYDRFFAAHPEVLKIGLIFEDFLHSNSYCENVFTPDSFDIPTDIIITERRIINVRQ
jgi:5-formyltetrahydrofolate cyclo-ligase